MPIIGLAPARAQSMQSSDQWQIGQHASRALEPRTKVTRWRSEYESSAKRPRRDYESYGSERWHREYNTYGSEDEWSESEVESEVESSESEPEQVGKISEEPFSYPVAA